MKAHYNKTGKWNIMWIQIILEKYAFISFFYFLFFEIILGKKNYDDAFKSCFIFSNSIDTLSAFFFNSISKNDFEISLIFL